MDQSLGQIMDRTVNFLANSVDNMYQKYYEAELLDKTPKEDKGFTQSLKTYLIATILFVRDEENIIYLGILCIILANIMLFFSITTS